LENFPGLSARRFRASAPADSGSRFKTRRWQRRTLLISSCVNGPLEKWGTQSMAWAEDDMSIVSEMAVAAGISLPQAGINRELCRALKPKRYQLELYGR